MDLSFSADEQALAAELGAWLAANLDPPGEFADFEAEVAWGRQWQARLAQARWVGISWPARFGGRDASPVEVAVYNATYARAKAPQPVNRVGINLAGPTLLAHGTEDQQQRWLPPILTAAELWCQLFSEPGAGSDLAALATRAVADDDGWVLNGQKVWTSYAGFARWGICLARTDPAAAKHRGLSYLVVDMHAPGVEIRPLRQLTGEAEFNEVFLTDVFVPRHHLVGPAGAGWMVANTTLAHERGTSFPFKEQVVHEAFLDELYRLAAATGRLDDEDVSDALASCHVELAGAAPAQLADPHPPRPGRAARSRVQLGEAGVDGHDPAHGRRRPGGRGPVVAAVGPLAAPVAVEQGGQHRRRHLGDPADHHRRAHPRPAPRAGQGGSRIMTTTTGPTTGPDERDRVGHHRAHRAGRSMRSPPR